MRRSREEQIGLSVARYLFENGLQSPLNEYRIIKNWSAVAGAVVEPYTKEVYIRNEILFVRITSPAVRSELVLRRRELASALNKSVGANVIKDIRFL